MPLGCPGRWENRLSGEQGVCAAYFLTSFLPLSPLHVFCRGRRSQLCWVAHSPSHRHLCSRYFFYIKLEAPCMKFMQEQALTTPVASQHHPSPTGYSRRWFQKVVPPSGPVSYQLFIIQDSLLPIYCHMMLEICYQKQNTSLTNEFIYLHQTALQLC